MFKPKLQPINKQQNQILNLLYKFRYLMINQLQKYFKHKDPHRIKVWLNDLKEKKYISVIKDETDPTKPYVFCLTTRAKYILEKNKDCNKTFLERLHKEKGYKEIFRNHLINIFDIYLYFLSKLEKGSTLHFLTQQDLQAYDFFPDDLPDAYLAVETKSGLDKYFIELFDGYRDSPGKIRFTVRKYIDYFETGDWETNTNNSPIPSIIFVLPNERRKKFVHIYGGVKLAPTIGNISLFLTTQDAIKSDKVRWEKVN